MYDGILLFFLSREARDRLLHKLQGLGFFGHKDNGAVDKYYGNIRHFFVTIYEKILPGIKLRGSLQRFAKGNNSGRYCFADIIKTVDEFCCLFCINPDEDNIQRLELGVNIPVKCPEAIIRSAMLYNGRTGIRDPKKNHFSLKWVFDQYTVKLYRKGPHLLRYEIRITDKRILKKLGLTSLRSLCDYNNFVKALHYLYKSADKFTFVPCDSKNRLVGKDKADWNNYRAESYWEEIGKDKRYRSKNKVNKLIREYNLIDWAYYLKHKTLLEGCLMLKKSLPALRANFSELGLKAETVAGPKGNRDRQTDNVNEMNIPVRVHPAVANVWWTTDVIISVLSYFPLLPRGPPSSFSFLRLLRYAYNVALLMPVVESMSLMWIDPASYRARACSIDLALAFGRPPFRPRARAAARPSIVRSWVRSRSNWLTPAKMVNSNLP